MDPIRLLALLAAFVAVIAWVHWSLRCKAIWLYAIVPLTWIVNELAFWAVRIFFPTALPVNALNMWSLAIHFQALIYVLAVPVIFWRCPMTPRRRAADHDPI